MTSSDGGIDPEAEITNAVFPGSTLRADGDSFLIRNSDRNPSLLFPARFAEYFGMLLQNAGIQDAGTLSCLERVYAGVPPPSPHGAHILNVGHNDVRQYGAMDGYDGEIANRISAMVAFLRLSAVMPNANAAVTYAGAGWSAVALDHDGYFPTVRRSTQAGDTAKIAFKDRGIAVGMIVHADVAAPAAVGFRIDGVPVLTLTPSGECTSASGYCARGIEFAGLSGATHTLEMENLDGGVFYLDWWGIPAKKPPVILVNGLTHMIASSYPLFPPYDNGDDSRMDAASERILAVAGGFGDDVIFCDMAGFDPNARPLIGADLVTPNNAGHLEILRGMVFPGGAVNKKLSPKGRKILRRPPPQGRIGGGRKARHR